jgi:putative hydrolase of HD superfamily
MVTKALILKLFNAAYMQRWNDKLCPVDLYELDKQAHKMVIAYFLGKFHEEEQGFSWIEIIEGGMFEFLQRIVLTDLKPPVFYKIKEDSEKYMNLNKWIYKQLGPFISPLGKDFCERFRDYFSNVDENLNRMILAAAHLYATLWEFDILERANPNGYEIVAIRERLNKGLEKYSDLEGMKQLGAHPNYKAFINLCGELRFQTRWSNLHRIPKTSVMGHSLLVAVLSYLFSLQVRACSQRCINNYFTGLFHDFPEVLTRDIISPVKGAVEGLNELVKAIEKEFMTDEVYALLPKEWHSQIELFTENEFTDVVQTDSNRTKVKSREIFNSYNEDRYSPRDGTLIRVADDLVAFVEAYEAINNGCRHEEFVEAKIELKRKYNNRKVGSLNLGQLYADFD